MSRANKSSVVGLWDNTKGQDFATLQSHPGYKIERIYNFPINCQFHCSRATNCK